MKELDEREIAKIKSHFDYFDEDSSGKLDLNEFRKLFHVIAPDAKRDEADNGYEAIDTDSSGEIDFDEFLDWWQSNWFVY
jgi:Ca2+-binding EF-hand superfamily protein